VPAPSRIPARPGERGQALVETALAFPLVLVAAVALLQFALFYHARAVVTAAVQDGARVAAAEDRTLADGVLHARALLAAGLGRTAADVEVVGTEGRDAVALEARGRLRTIVPWVGGATVPLGARAVVSKERFRVPEGGTP
jgi:Flp pilus assembly protein TadG